MIASVLAFFAGPLGRWVVLALLMAAAAAFGAAKMHAHDSARYEALAAKHASFVGGTQALGRAAAERNAKQALHDLKNKERTDEEVDRLRAAHRAALAGLRAAAAARNSGGGSVPAAPAGSRCPDGQTCFDTAEYQRAVGDFDRAARQLADEGTEVVQDLDAAKRWVNAR